MTQYKEGERFRAPHGEEYEVVDDVDTFDARDPDNVTVYMADDDGDVHGFYHDIVRSWDRVSSPLTQEEKEELADRARESWSKLAREFGTTVDDVEEAINDVKSFD